MSDRIYCTSCDGCACGNLAAARLRIGELEARALDTAVLYREVDAALYAAIRDLAVLRERPGEACIIGEYCSRHDFIHGAEAEELREKLAKTRNTVVMRVLETVDARDSVAWLEVKRHLDASPQAAPPLCPTCRGDGEVLHFYARGPNDPPGNQMIPCPTCRAATPVQGAPHDRVRCSIAAKDCKICRAEIVRREAEAKATPPLPFDNVTPNNQAYLDATPSPALPSSPGAAAPGLGNERKTWLDFGGREWRGHWCIGKDCTVSNCPQAPPAPSPGAAHREFCRANRGGSCNCLGMPGSLGSPGGTGTPTKGTP